MCSLVSEEMPANLRNKKILILEKKLLRYMATSDSAPSHPKMHNFGQKLTQPENPNSKKGNGKVTEERNCILL